MSNEEHDRSPNDIYFLRLGTIIIEGSNNELFVKSSIESPSRLELKFDREKDKLREIVEVLEEGGTLREISQKTGLEEVKLQEILIALQEKGVVSPSSPNSSNDWFDQLEKSIVSEYGLSKQTDKYLGIDLAVFDFANSGMMNQLNQLNVPGFRTFAGSEVGNPKHSFALVIGMMKNLPEMLEQNKLLLQERNPVIYVIYNGKSVLLFDVFPFKTACLEDIVNQYELNSRVSLYEGGVSFKEKPKLKLIFERDMGKYNPLIQQMLASFVLYDILHLKNSGQGLLSGQLLTLDAIGLEMDVVKLIINPKCNACGAGNVMPPAIRYNV